MEKSNQIQRLVVRKINPNEDELGFNRDMDGRIIIGKVLLKENAVIIESEEGVIEGIFSLNHYYFLRTEL
jgi:hypothetical protein